MKISDVALWILGTNCTTLAIDICSIILFAFYCGILILPFYTIFTILKYKRKS